MQRQSKEGFVLGLNVDGDVMIDVENGNLSEAGLMIYLLEFLGFLGVALLLAASPLLIRTVEYIRTLPKQSSREAAVYESVQARSDEGSEIRDEIRRMTVILEADRRGRQRDPRS
jgi:hypothetical protein